MSDILSIFAAELKRIISPLVLAANNDAARAALFGALGWQLDSLTGFPVATLVSDLSIIASDIEALASAAAAPPQSLGEVAALAGKIGQNIDAIRGLSKLAADPNLTAPPAVTQALASLGEELVEFLIDEYLLRYHPVVLQALQLLTLAAPPDFDSLRPGISGSGTQPVLRHPTARPTLRLDRLSGLLTDPVGTLRSTYLGAGLSTPDHARAAAHQIFSRAAPLLAATGAIVNVGISQPSDPAGLDPQRALSLQYSSPDSTASAGVGVLLQLLAQSEGGPGLAVTPSGIASAAWNLPTSTVDLEVAAAVGQILLLASGATLQSSSAATSASLSVQFLAADNVPAAVIGVPLGTSLQIGSAAITGHVAASASGHQISVELQLSNCVIALASADGDSFLAATLPPGGLTAKFDVSLGWATNRGLYLGPGTSLHCTIPVNAILAGIVLVSSVDLALAPGADGSVSLTAAITGGLKLGPVTATVSQAGVEVRLSFPSGSGNLGPANLDQLGVKPPTGVGLAIDAGPVSGGGFLSNDPATGRYAGALELRMESLALKAIGLLDTRLPDGSAGYSLVVIITAEFEAIQLGFGFTLTGVGGLAGINRTVVIDALRAGVRAHRLNNILFPPDPIRNAGQILSDMATIFPPDPGNYVFGPMVKLGWGTPAVLTLELGLLLELPPPLRLIVLGRIALNLPDPDAPVVRIQMDSLGVVDFGTGQVAVDAVLFDSNVAGFALTGSMALRAAWLGQPGFALAIGGFSPGFTPPAQFPALDRVTLALASGDNPRLRLSAYLALTSNTAQIGARLDLFVRGPFGITLQGELSFDALFQFNPFQFVVSIGGSVTIMSNGQPLLFATVQVMLTGPNGWHIQGQASFHLFCLSVSVAFDTTIGSAQPLPAPPPVQLAPLLEAALTNPANWAAALSADASTLLTFRAAPAAGKAPAHPLAGLAVHQRVLPLDIAIQRYGSATPADPGSFTITSVTVGTAKASGLSAIDDWFAPGQFLQLSDADSLQRPSFEKLHAGVAVTAPPFAHDPAPPPAVPANYRTMVYDALGEPPREVILPGPASMPAVASVPAAPMAVAASGSPAASRGRARFLAPGLALRLTGPQYALASTATLAAVGASPPSGGASSWTAAAQNLASYLAANPGQAGQVQIVAGNEVH